MGIHLQSGHRTMTFQTGLPVRMAGLTRRKVSPGLPCMGVGPAMGRENAVEMTGLALRGREDGMLRPPGADLDIRKPFPVR